jgi:hypothetical protein
MNGTSFNLKRFLKLSKTNCQGVFKPFRLKVENSGFRFSLWWNQSKWFAINIQRHGFLKLFGDDEGDDEPEQYGGFKK